jgi:hypothetical protein
MTQLSRLLPVVFLVLAHPCRVQAQVEDDLRRAIDMYENLQVELARDMFLRVTNSPFEVTQQQRVTAYLYLGATYGLLGNPDSALIFFRAAIERDPFIDLDQQQFTEVERAAFAEARRRTFRVGLRPIDSTLIDPRTETLPIQVITTHDGTLRIEVSAVDRPLRFPLFDGSNDGIRDLEWSGTDPRGTLVPPGNYELLVTGVSNVNRRVDSTSVLFTVEHVLETALEDTIPAFHSSQLLPERHPPSVATRELAIGLGVAAAAILTPIAMGSRDLGNPAVFSISVAGLAGASGVFAFLQRRKHPEIPANISENLRRQNERNRQNEEIRRRNAARLAETTLIIKPATGARR